MTRVRDYLKAHSIQEAVTLAAQSERPFCFLAGGTDLLLKLGHGDGSPITLIDVSDVAEMSVVEAGGDGWTIGGAVKMAQLKQAILPASPYRALGQGAGEVGSPQIRNLATIGGNVCTASPSADTAAPLLALDARATLLSPRGSRELPLAELWLGPGQTALAEGELLVSLSVPAAPPEAASEYIKRKVREALDLAIVGVSVFLSRAGGHFEARIALAAVAPTPIRARQAEALVNASSRLTDEVIREAARLAEQASSPISDVRGSARYRRAMVRKLTERALRQVREELGE